MTDPATITLAGVGATALTEGIKFLFRQAGDLIKRWHAHRDREARAAEPAKPIEVHVEVPTAIRGESFTAEVDADSLGAAMKRLDSAYAGLAVYAMDVRPIDPADAELLAHADALRAQLEQLYGRPLNFEGEKRDGPVVFGTVSVDAVRGGEAVGTRVKEVAGGQVIGHAEAKEVTGGSIIGTDVGIVRGRPR